MRNGSADFVTGSPCPGPGLMERLSLVSPLALHGLSMEDAALRFGLPLHLDPSCPDRTLPCGRLPCFSLHGHVGVCDYSFEPAFIRKRNERERHRVRCVNEGYARLREHLPPEFDDKRLSKVETLRAAIDYIKRLQRLLERHDAPGRLRLDVEVGMEKMALGDARLAHSANGEEG